MADNGPRISESDLQHIFDPFFTSKKQMAMGVGLSICSSIIVELHGTLEVRNLPEGVASFTIDLPV